MYRKILVPLDGSELAESSLEHLKEVAIGCHVPEVVLLTVVEPAEEAMPGFWGAVAGAQTKLEAEKKTETTSAIDYANMRTEQRAAEFEKKQQELADGYLDRVAEGLMKEGLNVTACVQVGKAAETIIDYANQNGVDLIIMASHGRGGNSRWDFGKVADRVIRGSNIPVLMASPAGRRV